jgi:hypothetical protein
MMNLMPFFRSISSENYCIIKNVARGFENEFDNILRKIFLNILYCGEESLKLIKQGRNKPKSSRLEIWVGID